MDIYTQSFLVPLQRTLLNISSFLPRLIVALALFAAFFGIAVVARRMANNAISKMQHVPWVVRVLIARTIYILVILIGILAAMSAVDINVTAVITSLGIAGFALGFALKDIIENFVSGVLLLFARPFEIGDQITAGPIEGTVYDIQIRTTTLHTYDDQVITVPNSQVFTSEVINHTKLGKRRYQVDFDTSITVDSEHVKREVSNAAAQDSEIADEPHPFIRITKLDSVTDVMSWRIYFWGKPHKADELTITSLMLDHIKHCIYDAGFSRPNPAAALVIKTLEPDEGPKSG